MSRPTWLPAPLQYADFAGDWDAFLSAGYVIFENDLVKGRVTYKGKKVILPTTYPDLGDGRHGAFWHIVSTGETDDEGSKLPDIQRLEVVGWIKPMLEQCPDDDLLEWETLRTNKKRRSSMRTVIWCKKHNFAIVLRELNYVYVLITAFTTERLHTQEKLQQEYDAS